VSNSSVAFVTNPDHAAHAVDGHVERPERLDAALDMLRDSGLLDRLHQLECPAPESVVLPPLHTQRYLERLDEVCAEGGGWFDPDTYCLPASCAVARSAVGACFAATDAVLRGDAQSAFAAVRPPGHHARPQQAMGFCLLNNVALAVRYAQRKHGVGRVAIVDIDVHHGNGTQDAFYDDPSVLYVSTHQYPFYPGTGRADELGAGPPEADGTNVNIPLPAGCGDAEYADVFDQLVEPIVRRYQPELLFVSLGFDAHYLDPLAMMSLSVDGYGALISRLRARAEELCGGKLIVALEGGYDLDAISWGVRRTVEVLLGETPTPDPLGPSPDPSAPDISGLLAELCTLHEL
jgi:acetoin utilization deacetylase AcuC-like enzyme